MLWHVDKDGEWGRLGGGGKIEREHLKACTKMTKYTSSFTPPKQKL